MSITKKKAGKVSILKDVLVFDEVPTAGSTNLVESGAVAEAVEAVEESVEAVEEAVEGAKFTLVSVSSASWTGAATATIDLDKLTDFGEIPAAVTGLTVSITAATAPMVSQCAFQFSLAASTSFATLAINLGSTACKIANAPDTWEAGKVYQVTMINGCAVVGVFA